MRNLICAILLFAVVALQGAWAQQLTVLTYNIKYDNPKDSINNWNNRKAFLTSQLRFYQPMIFGTQEGLKHQLDAIDGQLESYAYFGVGRDDGKNEGEFSAIFYDSTKVNLLKRKTFWLSSTPDVPSKGWDAAIKRICTYGLFETKNNKKFYVFNTHFDHVGKMARTESAQLILMKIKEINTDDFPVVLMGDLNLEPDSEGIQFILKQMQDAHVAAGDQAHGPSGTYNGFNFHEPVTSRIDYIFFTTSNLEVTKSAILSDSKDCRYPSDHLPVYAELVLH